jgi:hypothetical protein
MCYVIKLSANINLVNAAMVILRIDYCFRISNPENVTLISLTFCHICEQKILVCLSCYTNVHLGLEMNNVHY